MANYLAAPFGSYEYTLVTFGAANTDYTMTPTGPVLTATGNKQVAQTYSFLASPNQVLSSPGYAATTRARAIFEQRNARYGYKPLFYDMNIAPPASLNNAMAAPTFTASTGTSSRRWSAAGTRSPTSSPRSRSGSATAATRYVSASTASAPVGDA